MPFILLPCRYFTVLFHYLVVEVCAPFESLPSSVVLHQSASFITRLFLSTAAIMARPCPLSRVPDRSGSELADLDPVLWSWLCVAAIKRSNRWTGNKAFRIGYTGFNDFSMYTRAFSAIFTGFPSDVSCKMSIARILSIGGVMWRQCGKQVGLELKHKN